LPGAQALLHAQQAGLADDQLAAQVAEAMLKAGHPRLAASSLAASIKSPSTPQVLCLQAEVSLALGQHEQAAEQLLAAERLLLRGPAQQQDTKESAGSSSGGGNRGDGEGVTQLGGQIAALRKQLPAAIEQSACSR
jgi:hypothetical protein